MANSAQMTTLQPASLFTPLVDKENLKPNEPLIYARVSLISCAILFAAQYLLPSIASSLPAALITVAVGVVLIITLIRNEFLIANVMADVMAVQQINNANEETKISFAAAQRVIKTPQLIPQLNKQKLNLPIFVSSDCHLSLIGLACREDSLESFQALVAAGAQVSYDILTSLLINTDEKREKFQYLLEHTTVSSGHYSLTETEKYHLILDCRLEQLDSLIDKNKFGIDPNTETWEDNTALMTLALLDATTPSSHSLERAKKLVELGADPALFNRENKQAYQLCKEGSELYQFLKRCVDPTESFIKDLFEEQ